MNAPVRGIALREASRNLIAHRLTTVVLAALSAVIGSAVVVTTTLDVSSIVAAHEKQLSRGVNLLNLSAEGTGLVATECSSLQSIGGVLASGAILRITSGNPISTPSSQIGIAEVSSGFLEAMFPSLSSAVVVVAGHSLGESQGLVAGSNFVYRDEAGVERAVRIDAIAPDVERADGYGWTLFLARVPRGAVDSCLVAAAPGSGDRISEVLPSFFTSRVQVTPLVFSSELERDPEAELHARPTQLGWLVGGVFLVALTLLLAWTRRREFSIYRLSGFDRRHTGAIAGIEALIAVAIPAQYGAGLAAMAMLRSETEVVWRAVAADDARFVLILCLAAMLAALVAAAGSTLGRLRSAP